MRQAERIYDQVRRRIQDTTGNKPTGALGEAVALSVYSARCLEPQSNKAYDLVTPDGRRIQVKTRVLGGRVTMFSRQYHDDYDAVFLLVLDADFEVAWAAELSRAQALQCSSAKKREGTSGAGSRNILYAKTLALFLAGETRDLTDEATKALAAL